MDGFNQKPGATQVFKKCEKYWKPISVKILVWVILALILGYFVAFPLAKILIGDNHMCWLQPELNFFLVLAGFFQIGFVFGLCLDGKKKSDNKEERECLAGNLFCYGIFNLAVVIYGTILVAHVCGVIYSPDYCAPGSVIYPSTPTTSAPYKVIPDSNTATKVDTANCITKLNIKTATTVVNNSITTTINTTTTNNNNISINIYNNNNNNNNNSNSNNNNTLDTATTNSSSVPNSVLGAEERQSGDHSILLSVLKPTTTSPEAKCVPCSLVLVDFALAVVIIEWAMELGLMLFLLCSVVKPWNWKCRKQVVSRKTNSIVRFQPVPQMDKAVTEV